MWRLSFSKNLTKRNSQSLIRSQPLRYFSSSPSIETLQDESVNCLMLHPVSWPNHGPQIELYLAEEAIGLVKSLNWEVVKGPLWKKEEEESTEGPSEQLRDELQTDALTEERADSDQSHIRSYRQRRLGQQLSHRDNYKLFKKEKIHDGDYVYGPQNMQGVFYKKGGIVLEYDGQEDEQYDMYDEWKNELLRESIAKSSLIKVRKIHSSTFFQKGKLNDLGYFLKDNEDVNVVFINSTLTSLQQKKLEKRWNDIILSREDRLRRYYLKSAQKEKYNPTDVESESSQMSELELDPSITQRKIRVIDRFGIILQIFAQRAKSRTAQLQIELAWLKYARTMLVRGGAPTFGQLGKIFHGNMMRMDVQQVEIKSARGRKSGSGGFTGGGGETQLELEKRRLTERETKLTKELEDLNRRTQHEKTKKEQAHQSLPLVALIGYTNAGKTALMNLCTGAHLESKDLLFQTLNTTHKRFRMPKGQTGLMLDTVGFITDLPHGLVESFKATLDEIHFADLLVHVRDISHPHTNYQRNAVIKVLKEIGVPEEVFATKYIEVWNKMDLLADQTEFTEQLKQELVDKQPEYPVVMMSCKDGTNKDLFLSQIEAISSQVMGKRFVSLKYKYSDHNKVCQWMRQHANINQIDNIEYDDEGYITIRVPIDDVLHQKYLKEFEPQRFAEEKQQIRRNKFGPPPGWND